MTSFLDGKKIVLPTGAAFLLIWLLIWGVRMNDAKATQALQISALEAGQAQYIKDMTTVKTHLTILRVQNKEIARAVDAHITDIDKDDVDGD